MANNSGGLVVDERSAKWLLGIASSVVTLVFGLMLNTIARQGREIDELQEWRAATEANRFTDGDALNMYLDFQAYIRENVPPPEVALQLLDHDERLDRLEAGR